MGSSNGAIVIVADANAPAGQPWIADLEAQGYRVLAETSGAGVLARVEAGGQVVITGSHLQDMDGLQLIARLNRSHPRTPIIMVTDEGSSQIAIEAIKRGAEDILSEPVDPGELMGVVDEALEAAGRMFRPVEIAPVYAEQDTLIGRSRAMRRVYKELGRISATPLTVLIRGETGTGKELIARAIYQHGHRAHKPFVAVNCAAIPEHLLESELFGHERGAFTGAVATRIGRFEQAHNATLFLDEIGDMNLSLQSKLLRVLQEKQIRRVGGREEIPVDARVIAATHQPLEEMMRRGSFREDLFYRLNVASISIPPLRERPGDVPLLVEHFLASFGRELSLEVPRITEDALAYLTARPWPGNIRQLQNVLRKALLRRRRFAVDKKTVMTVLEEAEAMASHAMSADEALQVRAREVLGKVASGDLDGAYGVYMGQAERALLEEAMRLSGGNQAKAARWLGISRLTLREKLRGYALHPRPRGGGEAAS